MSFSNNSFHFLDNLHAHRASEDEAEDSSSDSSSEGMVEEDEETYVKFVQSVFCDDLSGCSNTDEDDEEDYVPENDDDDDEDDRDLVRVQNRELRELVDGCWQTIAGEAPTITAVPAKEESLEGTPVKKRASAGASYAEPLSPPINASSGLFDNIEDELDFSLLSPMPGLARASGAGAPPVTNSTVGVNVEGASKAKAATAAGPSVISNMVTKLFSDHETSEAHVEGMPVHACRKLVARQMSMATQLLVQMLLQADERSECFTKAYTSLMELSNLREAALKKATLVQMNFNNATTIRNHVLDRQQQKLRESHGSSAGSTNDVADDDSSAGSEDEYGMQAYSTNSSGRDGQSGKRSSAGSGRGVYVGSDVARLVAGVPCTEENSNLDAGALDNVLSNNSSASSGRRMTRSSMLNQTASHSVFNVPILAKVATLFDMVDLSRRSIKQRCGSANSSQPGALTARGVRNTDNGGDNNPQQRVRLLNAVREQVYTIMPALNSRAWRCLLPSAVYPLPLELIRTLDPTTLTGR
jgi:hypothetical protein